VPCAHDGSVFTLITITHHKSHKVNAFKNGPDRVLALYFSIKLLLEFNFGLYGSLPYTKLKSNLFGFSVRRSGVQNSGPRYKIQTWLIYIYKLPFELLSIWPVFDEVQGKLFSDSAGFHLL